MPAPPTEPSLLQTLTDRAAGLARAAAERAAPLMRTESLLGEVTRWSLLLALLGLLATLAVVETVRERAARNLADFAMIDFLNEEIEATLQFCRPEDTACLSDVSQNESGGLWSLVDETGTRRASFSLGLSAFASGEPDCPHEDAREVGRFEIFTCQSAADDLSYRVALRAGGEAPALVALESVSWEQRVARASERLVGWRSLRLALGAMAATLVAILALNLLLTRARLRRHFNLLGRELDAFREGEAARIGGAYPSEIQPLVNSFNRALEKNAGLVERQRRNVNKMAHDLRHQLVNIDVAARQEREDGGDGGDGAELAGELQTLNQLVERYLTLVDWIGPGEGLQDVSVRAPLEAVRKAFARRFRPQAPDTPLEIEIDCPEGLRARIHPTDLQIVLTNLMTNAHKFAVSRIRLSARRDASGLVLRVEDDGPGVPEADRARILNWGARLDDRLPGSGFGLTIVAEQMRELYGGEVILGESELGGLCVEVRAPLSRA